jgi:hypothetical protein
LSGQDVTRLYLIIYRTNNGPYPVPLRRDGCSKTICRFGSQFEKRRTAFKEVRLSEGITQLFSIIYRTNNGPYPIPLRLDGSSKAICHFGSQFKKRGGQQYIDGGEHLQEKKGYQ